MTGSPQGNRTISENMKPHWFPCDVWLCPLIHSSFYSPMRHHCVDHTDRAEVLGQYKLRVPALHRLKEQQRRSTGVCVYSCFLLFCALHHWDTHQWFISFWPLKGIYEYESVKNTSRKEKVWIPKLTNGVSVLFLSCSDLKKKEKKKKMKD